ncbi:MAG TPA: diguanylate cyclase [Burkholderiales bacterium]|nr:diguanylate cyclase [Burkholderiales bacterium]
MKDSIRSRWILYLGQVGLLAAAYVAAAKASLLLAIPPGYATPIWPPSGIALAATLMLGARIWPGIWLGAALINFAVASSLVAAIVIGCGNTLEALAGAALVRRYIADVPPYFDRAWNVVTFVALAALSCTIAATIGVGSLALGGTVSWPEFVQNWWTWWQGDTTGIIITTPLILAWGVRNDIVWSRATILEAAGFGLSLLLVAFVVFGDGIGFLPSFPLTFMILPFIIWAAFRFSRREVTTAIAAVCCVAVWYSIEGRGPFALHTLNLSLLMLLAFISTVVVTGEILSAVVGERKRTTDKLELALHELRGQAITDPLTGLFNRRYLSEFLLREWIRARRKESSIAIIMIDIDYFKQVNDTYGHEAGDVVLTEIAALLKSQIRGSDIACRFGGEEFALVLPDATLDGVQRRAEDIWEATGRLTPKFSSQQLGRITASFGVALSPEHAGDPESLLRAADQALYQAKAAGRDRVVISSAKSVPPKPANESAAA